MNTPDDAALVAEALAGGPGAFGPIVERYQDAVFGVALARLGDFHEAQDAAQAVFVEAFERLESLREPARLGAWLRKIAIHRSVDTRRRRKRFTEVSETVQAPDDTHRRELQEEVLAAVAKLGKAQREAITLFYISGYSMAEVAEICDTKVATVKSRLHEARQRLKEEMVHMVEDVLKSEAPREDFAQRVFEAITGRLSWEARHETLQQIGARGVEGFVRALQSGDWHHRRNAVQFEDRLHGPESLETIIEMLKCALGDRNKKVRGGGVAGLMQMDVPAERKVKEFLPLIVPMLEDASARVRRMTAWYLLDYASHVPADLAARAYFGEKRETRRWPLAELLKKAAAKGTNR